MPCNPERPSGPSTQAARCACRCRAGQQPPRPGNLVSTPPEFHQRPISCTYHGEIIEWPGLLDVLESLLKVAQLLVDNSLGLLCALDGLGLESLDGLDLPVHIVGLGLEGTEAALNLVDDGGVLEDGSVVGEVDGLGLLGQNGDLAARVVVALLESLEGSGSGAFEAELGAQLRPVEFESGATL